MSGRADQRIATRQRRPRIERAAQAVERCEALAGAPGVRLQQRPRKPVAIVLQEFARPRHAIGKPAPEPLGHVVERLAAFDRLRRSLDPRAPLTRGYALVSAAGHPVVASRAVAAAQSALTLEFADGTLEVGPAGGAMRKARSTAPAKRPAQDDLFE